MSSAAEMSRRSAVRLGRQAYWRTWRTGSAALCCLGNSIRHGAGRQSVEAEEREFKLAVARGPDHPTADHGDGDAVVIDPEYGGFFAGPRKFRK